MNFWNFISSVSLILSIQIATISSLTGQNWELSWLSDMPQRVSNNAVVEAEVGGVPHVFSFGGIDSTRQSSGIHLKSFKYNVNEDIWTTLPDLPDTLGKIASGASYLNGKIYIIGGYHVFPNGGEKSSSNVHIFDVETNQFIDDGAEIPVPIDDQVQALWNDSLIYVISGWSENTNVPDVQIYNPTSDEWKVGTSVPNNNIYKSFGASGSILNDTIFYFGGAMYGTNFPVQSYVRKGVINPNSPTEIDWDFHIVDPLVRGYRMASTIVTGKVHWIGGSGTTYNYNGIAYNGSGGVEPIARDLFLVSNNGYSWNQSEYAEIPMDLRGIASINDTIKIIAGGMESGQQVSNKVLKLSWLGGTSDIVEETISDLSLFPNPSDDFFAIDFRSRQMELDNIQILDFHNRLVAQYNPQSYYTTSLLPNGKYIVKVHTEYGEFAKTLIVQHK